MHVGCPAVPVSGCPAIPTAAAGDAGLCLLLFSLGPVPASAGCQLKLKPKQALPERCQGTGSAGKEGEETWLGGGLAPESQGACAAKCCLLWDIQIAQRLAVGCFLWCPLRYLCQASVNPWCCSLGMNAVLQACSLVSCCNNIS